METKKFLEWKQKIEKEIEELKKGQELQQQKISELEKELEWTEIGTEDPEKNPTECDKQ